MDYEGKNRRINNYNKRSNQLLEEIQENWDYYCGDTFQYWTGPMPPKDHVKYDKVLKTLERVYRSQNVIRDAITYYCDGLVGKPFNFYLSLDKPEEQLTESEKKQLNEDDEYLQMWWDWQKELAVSQLFGKPIVEAVTQMLVTGCGYLRIYSPKRFANNSAIYKRIALHAPCFGSVSVERDNDGFFYKATYNYSGGSEIYTLLDNGLTQIEDVNGVAEVDYGGRLPIFELRGNCILNDDAKQTQNAINKTLTLKDQNVDSGGFIERVLLNAQMPGKWVSDPSVPGGERFEPNEDAIHFGPNKITYVQGMPIGDAKNPTAYTSPSINYRQPVDITMFEKSLSIDYTAFFWSVGLGHLLSSGDGSISGVSRETLKGDFMTRLEGYSEIVESCLKGSFNLVLLLLSKLDNKPQLLEYSPVIEMNLTMGKPLPEERQQVLQEFGAGIRSKTNSMVECGITDPDAEMQLINREQDEAIERLAGQQKIQQEVANQSGANIST